MCMLRKEWKSLFKNKLLLVVVIAVIAIPTIYTTLFLGSMWDPYGNLDKLPVAVVNKDKPVTYNDKELKVGEELVDKLKDEDSLCFNFVDQETAARGLKNGTYYMVITIPEDFSENASTVMDEEPQKMELDYDTNPGTNYIASKMSETAMEKIKNSVAEEVTKTYVETVFDQIVTVGDGMQEAADGSEELKDGVTQLVDGNNTISENLNVLADSSVCRRCQHGWKRSNTARQWSRSVKRRYCNCENRNRTACIWNLSVSIWFRPVKRWFQCIKDRT